MSDTCFDAVITIGPHHLMAAGLDPARDAKAAIEAVRTAVQRMAGANWIDVEAGVFPPACPGWVTVYPCGRSLTPDMPVWRARCRVVEEMAKAALVAVATAV